MADTPNVQLGPRKLGRSKVTSIPGRCLGISARSTLRLIEEVRKGFPYSTLVRFHKESGLAVGTIADLIRLPPRTMMRRKAEGRLQPDESERLLRISAVFEKAVELFEGDAAAARRWLTAPSKELSDKAPLDFARTEIGAQNVEDMMGRLEHGVFT